MFQRMIRHAALCGIAILSTSSASAQFFPGSTIDPCAPARPVAFAQVAAIPQQCTMTCQPALVPVAQTCYQTVPVTEYQEIKRTVERPVVETRYVDQEVTAYRPITEARMTEVPTVSYQNVTEYQTVTRDMGQWVTQRECISRPAPCQYDPRPGLLGGMNRFGYSLRSAFTPNFRTRRDYVPNYVAQTIPITRQVAIPGTRQVTYNVTRMEPYQTTRKVAVNSVRMVAEEVTHMQPVTVMRTIPTGTRVAYVSPSALGTATAALPGGTNGSQSASIANGPLTPVRPRTADARNAEQYNRNRSTNNPPYDNNKSATQPFTRDPGTTQIDQQNYLQNTSQVEPATRHAELWEPPVLQQTPTSGIEPARVQPAADARPLTANPPTRPSRSVPSIVRVNQWTQRPATNPSPTAHPVLAAPGVSVAVD